MQHRTGLIDVLFVVSPHSLLLDIAGPAEAFRIADLHRTLQGLPPRFHLRFAGPSAELPSSVGLVVAGLEALPARLAVPTWVVLVGLPSAHVGQVTPAIADIAQWLGRTLHHALQAPGTPHRLVTVCSGALLAARAGLMRGRRCTTHHDLIDDLRALAHDAQVEDDQIFVVDGPVASSSGVTAGIDLALHLIAAECGDALAASVAESMVVYLRRSSRDPKRSPYIDHRRHSHPVVHKVQDAITAQPELDWDMAALAAVGHVTERHLLRVFMDHAGVSPMQCLQSIRLERARQSLEHGASVSEAAEVSGFRSSLNLRRAWKRQWGGSPRDARRADAPIDTRLRADSAA